MRFILEVDIDVLPEEIESEENGMALIEALQRALPSQFHVPFTEEPILLNLLKTHIFKTQKNGN